MSSPLTTDTPPALEISKQVVKLMSAYTGRGPTRARTYFSDDLVTVVLRDLLTKGERSLVAGGKTELVLATRRSYQDTMETDLTAAVEGVTGRRVLAFLSANRVDPDVAIESFLLAPANGAAGDPKPGRT
jgi:uncharacterized protein YbcI